MSEFNIINLNDFTWQLNVAVAGGVFSIFSLIYNDYYIYFGLITFSFWIFGHVVYKLFEWIFRSKGVNSPYYFIVHIANFILILAWVKILLFIY